MCKPTKKFYLDYNWYFKLFIFLIMFISLCLAFYICCFKEYWYISGNSNVIQMYISFFNAEALLSFYSVQVSLFTCIYLFFLVILNNYEEKTYLLSTRFKGIVSIWNIVMLIIFFAGIVSGIGTSEGFDQYSKNQIIMSGISHLLCPLLYIYFYFINSGWNKITIKYDLFKDGIIVCSYPFIYLLYIILRANLFNFLNEGYINEYTFRYWYDFLDFDNPMFGWNPKGYFIFIVICFIFIYNLFLWFFSYINNCIYKRRIFFIDIIKLKNNKELKMNDFEYKNKIKNETAKIKIQIINKKIEKLIEKNENMVNKVLINYYEKRLQYYQNKINNINK